LIDLIRAFPAAKLSEPWQAGEWTIKEIVVHIIDTERVFAYRALRFARNDQTALPGFEQTDYVPYTGANERQIEDILAEYRAVRAATISLFDSLSDAALTRGGSASGYPVTVRSLAYQIVGHELHHIESIKENYG
jgi:uncharacterized damage-inducible protein DinB